MPSKSKKQAKFMRAVAHGWKPDRMKGPTRAVAKEFVNADRRTKVNGYQFGGVTRPGMYGGALQQFGQQRPPMRPTRPPIMADPRQRPMPPQRRMPPNRGPRGPAMPGPRGMPPRRMPPRGGFPMPGQGGPMAYPPGKGPRRMVPPSMPPGYPGGMLTHQGPGTGLAGRGPRGALGQIQQQFQQQRGYPGGGNPNVGGRNPIARGARSRLGGRGRGRTFGR